MDAPSLFANLGFSALGVVLLLLLGLVLSCYVKIVTVLSIVRLGLGAGSLPAVIITGGLSLVLTFFVMHPTLEASSQAMEQALRTSPQGEVAQARAIAAGLSQWKVFLQRHSHEKETARFAELAARSTNAEPQVAEALASSWRVLAPAFFVSELKEAFQTGFSLFLPFLVVELVVGHLLIAVGLERFDPSLASLPFKLLLFVTVDGWSLITTGLVSSYL